MPWLRVDDKFPSNPKVAQLTDREFRVHMRVLCYCAEHRTQGQLPAAIWTEIVGLTPRMGDRFLAVGLWDRNRKTKQLSVHDFPAYNPKDPTGAERQARHRRRQRNGEVTDEVTPSRVGAGARPVPSPRSKRLSRGVTSSADSAEGSAADVPGDQPRPYTRESGEALVRNGWWADPHLPAALRDHFSDIPDEEVDRLCDMAGDLAEGVLT